MLQSAAKDTVARLLTGFHKLLLTTTGGRIGNEIVGMPVLTLTTTGRKSGQPRQTVLTTPVQEGGTIVLVASYGGTTGTRSGSSTSARART